MKNWKDILKSIAPSIATAIGGPAAGIAVKFVGEHLLGDAKATEDDLEQFILNASPADMQKMKEIDNAFKLEMKKLGLEEFALQVEDRKSARELFKVDKRPQIFLSGLFIGGYFFLLFGILTGEVTIDNNLRDIVLLLLGIITREVPTIMQFWFGSSSGSKDKYPTGVKDDGK